LDLLATTCALVAGVTVTVGHAQRHRVRRDVARRLARSDVTLPLAVGHLSPALSRLTVAARTVRLLLETPVTRYLDAPIRATPWGRRQVCDEYDLALSDARRALWEWIVDARRLGRQDRACLRGLGVDLVPIGEVFTRGEGLERTDDIWDERLWPPGPDVIRAAGELSRAIESLGRFERAMLTAPHDPYR
jgi:hypothetical protein